MKIIDRYIFRKFLVDFILCYIALAGLFVILDLASKISDFLEVCSVAQLLTVIPQYYFLGSFVILDAGFSLLILGAALMVVFTMVRTNEVIALLAMGVSPARILAPIIAGAFLVSCAFTVVREVYLPRHLPDISQKPAEFVQRSDTFKVLRADDDKSHVTFKGDKMIMSKGLLLKPSVVLKKEVNKYGNRILAAEGVFCEAEKDRKQGWLLRGVTAPVDLLQKGSLTDLKSNETIVYSPADTPWLKEDEVFVVTSLNPIHLVAGENWLQYGSVFDLYHALKDPTFQSNSVSLAMRVHSRFWRPLTDLIPLFLGAPFVLLRSDRKMLSILQGLCLGAAYLLSQYVSFYLGQQMDVAGIGIWGSPLVFVPIAAIVFSELTRKNLS